MAGNPRNSVEFLLGEIHADVKSIKAKQDEEIKERKDLQDQVDILKSNKMWVRGFIAASGLIGGFFGSLLTHIKSLILTS